MASLISTAVGKSMIHQTTIKSDFIGSFKVGDNIAFNCDILIELYKVQTTSNDAAILLRKPIIITIASIAEAVLYDLYLKINFFTREGVPNIVSNVLQAIRAKQLDEFNKYIENAKKHKLLGADLQLYDDLHELRKLRNRVHIQNTGGYFEPDEIKAFSKARQTAAQATLLKLLKYLETNHARPLKGNVRDFVVPWN